MTPEIRPLRPDDLPALSRFLAEGFGAPADAGFAAPDVLRWKYLEPIGGDEAPRSFVAEAGGAIVGHVGICPTSFHGLSLPPAGVTALHMIDWLGARTRRGVGAALMRQAHRHAETQYVLVANDRARLVTGGAGYEPRAEVPLFRKVLRAGYRWKESEHGPGGRLLRVARDVARTAFRHEARPRVAVELRQVPALGCEVSAILDDVGRRAILTDRSPARLEHALRHPRAELSGWLILSAGAVRGFALLNVVPRGAIRAGKLVECLLEGQDVDLWHAAAAALTAALAARGADFATGFGSTPWMAEALGRCGFAESGRLAFTLRDRNARIPPGATFHLSPFEADDAYA